MIVVVVDRLCGNREVETTMVKQVSVLSVFVASPTDVAEEREALEEVIRELNLQWQGSKGVNLELSRWETHAYPSVGSDPQSVINDQIGNECDIFIGILWKHFGTPTPRDDSGTAEEFSRALNRYQSNPDSLRIMFYFKTTPADLGEIDPQQLSRVNEFKGGLGSKGTLYWEFKEREQFKSFLRLHLTRHVDDWGKRWGSTAGSHPQADRRPERAPEEEPEEEGFLDLIEVGTASFETLTEQATRISGATELLGNRISERSSELAHAQSEDKEGDLKALKRICNHAADHLDQYARVMETEIPMFAEMFQKGIDCYSRAVSLMPDFRTAEDDQQETLKGAQSTILTLHQTVGNTKSNIESLRASIADTPRMTTRYNQARRRALKSVDSFIGELQSGFANSTPKCKRVIESELGACELTHFRERLSCDETIPAPNSRRTIHD